MVSKVQTPIFFQVFNRFFNFRLRFAQGIPENASCVFFAFFAFFGLEKLRFFVFLRLNASWKFFRIYPKIFLWLCIAFFGHILANFLPI